MEYVCDKHWESNEEKLKEKKDINKNIIINKISDFQDCNSLYPCMPNSFYRQINSKINENNFI